LPLAKAMELILTAGQLTAQEALQYGLVNKVVPAAEVLAAAEALADTLCEMGPLALRRAKQASYQGLDLPLEEGLELELELFRQTLLSEDAVEGPKAFAEKRKPEFHAR